MCAEFIKKTVILASFILGIAAAANAAPPEDTPSSLEKVTVITAEEARDLMGKGIPIFDVRVAHEFVEEHIKGAVSIPYKEKSKKGLGYDPREDSFDLSKLPREKSAPMIFYCNAGKCWKSYKASRAAVEAGYTHVYWLRGGIPEWKQKNFPVE